MQRWRLRSPKICCQQAEDPGSCSVTKSCPILCMDCSIPGFPVLHHLPEFAQTHVHWVGDVIQPAHPLLPPSPPSFHLSQDQISSMSWLFISGGQSTGASASAPVLPMNIQGWSPLGLTGLISLLFKKLSKESSPAPQFESINSLALSFL